MPYLSFKHTWWTTKGLVNFMSCVYLLLFNKQKPKTVFVKVVCVVFKNQKKKEKIERQTFMKMRLVFINIENEKIMDITSYYKKLHNLTPQKNRSQHNFLSYWCFCGIEYKKANDICCGILQMMILAAIELLVFYSVFACLFFPLYTLFGLSL